MDDAIYSTAIKMLAAREHSCFELKTKLKRKGYADLDIDPIIKQLLQDKYLNEERFTEVFVSSKINRGMGPVKIQMELQQRSIDSSLIDAYLDFNEEQWLERAKQVRNKRFGKTPPTDNNDKAKQIRFLQQRGFTQKQIMSVIKSNIFE